MRDCAASSEDSSGRSTGTVGGAAAGGGRGGGGACVHARAAVALVSCEDGALLGNASAQQVRIGDCLFDGSGATQVYYRDDAWAPGLVHIEAGDKRTAVTDHHLVHTADGGVVPARLVRAGTALLPNDTVTSKDTNE